MIPDNNNEQEKDFKNNAEESKSEMGNSKSELDNTDKTDEYNYGKKPKNHTTTEERLTNPDRGE